MLLAALGVAGVAYVLGAEWTSIRHGIRENHVLDAAVGLSFFGSGIIALDRKPGNRIGPLMVGYAFAAFMGNWSNWAVPGVPAFASMLSAFDTLFLAQIVLGYPSGRLRTTFDRFVLTAICAVSLGSSFVVLLTWDPRAFGCADCVWARALFPSRAVADAAYSFDQRSGLVLVPLFLTAVVLRWRRGSPAERRDLAPLWIATSMLALVFLLGAFVSPVPDDPFARFLWELRAVLEIGVPVVFVWGLLSTRLARSAVSDLVVELERPLPAEDLRQLLGRTLADPSLDVAYAIDDDRRWVDAAGRAGRPSRRDRERPPGSHDHRA